MSTLPSNPFTGDGAPAKENGGAFTSDPGTRGIARNSRNAAISAAVVVIATDRAGASRGGFTGGATRRTEIGEVT